MHIVKRAQIRFILEGILLISIALYLLMHVQACCGSAVNSNAHLHGSNFGTNLFDGGYNHTYYSNATFGNLNVTLNSTLVPFMAVYGNLLLTGTEPSIGSAARFGGSVVAINIESGNIVWRTPLPNFVMSEPLVVGNEAVVEMGKSQPSYPNGVIAINISSGTIIWQKSTNQTAMVMPIYVDNVIYASGGGFVYLMNPENGMIIKSLFSDPEISMAQPVLINGAIYQNMFYDGNYSVVSINTSTWTTMWKKNVADAHGLVDTSPSFYLGNVIIGYYNLSADQGDGDVIVEGINSSDGSVRWKSILYNNTPKISNGYAYNRSYMQYGPVLSPITVHRGIGYIDSSLNGILYAFNATSGKTIWAFHTDGDNTNPNIKGNALFIVNEGGELFAINATSGNLISARYIGMPSVANGVIIAQNSIVVGGINGTIRTFTLNSIV